MSISATERVSSGPAGNRGLVVLDCDGTLLHCGKGSPLVWLRETEHVSALGQLPAVGIDLTLATRAERKMAALYLKYVKERLGLPVGNSIYSKSDVSLEGEGSPIPQDDCDHYKNFEVVLWRHDIPFRDAPSRVVTVEDFVPLAALNYLWNNYDLAAQKPFQIEPPILYSLTRLGNPFPLPGGYLPAATIFIPRLGTEGVDEFFLFTELAATTERIIKSEGRRLPKIPVNHAVLIQLFNAWWLYCSSTLRLEQKLIPLYAQAQIRNLALEAWQKKPSPQRYLFYWPYK